MITKIQQLCRQEIETMHFYVWRLVSLLVKGSGAIKQGFTLLP